MPKLRAASAASGLLLAFARPAGAQDVASSRNDGEERFFDPATEVKRYDHILLLSDAQKDAVRKILDERLAAFKKNAAARREFGEKTRKLDEQIRDLHRQLARETEKFDAVQRDLREKLRRVMSPDQLDAFDSLDSQAQRRENQDREREKENAEQERAGASGSAPGR